MTDRPWFGSGPAVARLFHRLLAATFIVAWLSLGVQVHRLIGSRGLLPLSPFLEKARAEGLGFGSLPTVFWIGASDGALTAGIVVGVVVAIVWLLGFRSRTCAAVSTLLYLSYAVGARTFLSFQWDNLLLECGAGAALLPTHRRARWVHVLFLLVLFKLYWESGVAKWQSFARDWHDGSAMTHYYETAPLPTWLASYAHALPRWWHRLESWLTLGFELVVPFFMFGRRRARRFALVVLSGFQLINALTANYGFFCWLALWLHVFLLDDEGVEGAEAWLRRRAHLRPAHAPTELVTLSAHRRAVERAIAGVVIALFCVLSLLEGLIHFTRGGGWLAALEPIHEQFAPFRIVNTYHLFGHITRERIEPELQTFDGKVWTAHPLHYKPGDPARRPRFVQPHQPRLDFQLWFYGLSYQRGTPDYVVTLLDRLCHDPTAIAGFFASPLPANPEAVRIVLWDYHFSRDRNTWWTRTHQDETRPIPCGDGIRKLPF